MGDGERGSKSKEVFQEEGCSYCVHTTEKMNNQMRITQAGIGFDSIYLVTLTEIHLNRWCRYCMLKGKKVKMRRQFYREVWLCRGAEKWSKNWKGTESGSFKFCL